MKRGVTSDGGYLNVSQSYNPGANNSGMSPLTTGSPYLSNPSLAGLTPTMTRITPNMSTMPLSSETAGTPNSQLEQLSQSSHYSMSWPPTPKTATISVGYPTYSTHTPTMSTMNIQQQSQQGMQTNQNGMQHNQNAMQHNQTMIQQNQIGMQQAARVVQHVPVTVMQQPHPVQVSESHGANIQNQIRWEQGSNIQLQQQQQGLVPHQGPVTSFNNTQIVGTYSPPGSITSQQSSVAPSVSATNENKKSSTSVKRRASGDKLDEDTKRLKRLETNRRSAQQSRRRKKEQLNNLASRATELQEENKMLKLENQKLLERLNVAQAEIDKLKEAVAAKGTPSFSPLFSSPLSVDENMGSISTPTDTIVTKEAAYSKGEKKAKEVLLQRNVSSAVVDSLQKLMQVPLSSQLGINESST